MLVDVVRGDNISPERRTAPLTALMRPLTGCQTNQGAAEVLLQGGGGATDCEDRRRDANKYKFVLKK